MWLIRAGKNAAYYDKILANNKVFLPWEGYHFNLSGLKEKRDYREAVMKEKQVDSDTAISTWAGQLYTFVNGIKVGETILIPSLRSQTFTLATINGDYEFNPDDVDGLYHAREIIILKTDIPRSVFPQHVLYSLGAYRTLFRLKDENEIMRCIDKINQRIDKAL